MTPTAVALAHSLSEAVAELLPRYSILPSDCREVAQRYGTLVALAVSLRWLHDDPALDGPDLAAELLAWLADTIGADADDLLDGVAALSAAGLLDGRS